MHNPPQQCGFTGRVPYTALRSWKQSVVGNARLWFTGTNVDYFFVLWEWKPNKVLCEVHDTPKPAVSAGLDSATRSWTAWPPFPLLLLVPLKWRCCLLGLKLIYTLREEEVYCSAQRHHSKKQSESKGWLLINQSFLFPEHSWRQMCPSSGQDMRRRHRTLLKNSAVWLYLDEYLPLKSMEISSINITEDQGHWGKTILRNYPVNL